MSNYSLTVKKVVPVSNTMIFNKSTVSDTVSSNRSLPGFVFFGAQYSAQNKVNAVVTFSGAMNTNNFQLNPRDDTSILCAVSGIYTMAFEPNTPSLGGFYLDINGQRTNQYGTNYFSEIHINKGDNLKFLVAQAGASPINGAFGIGVPPTQFFAATYNQPGIPNLVTFSGATNTAKFHIDPSNNTHLICDVAGIYDMNFKNNDLDWLYLYVNGTYICAGSAFFRGIKLNIGDVSYFQVTNGGSGPTNPFFITGSLRTTGAYCGN